MWRLTICEDRWDDDVGILDDDRIWEKRLEGDGVGVIIDHAQTSFMARLNVKSDSN